MSDQATRDRILSDLDTNFLVEAGAGSGKTTALVGRLLAYVRRGTPVEQLAAVTFTRKAATELRERFQEVLETTVRKAREHGEDAVILARLDGALEDLDRAFLGTIHSFCGRLLREHPLEAGLDPGFEEISEEEWPDIRRDFWSRWLERCRRSGDPALEEVRRLGIDPRILLQGFEVVVRYPDVEFPLADRPAPNIDQCRTQLEHLLDEARDLMPGAEPEGGWDHLQRTVRMLEFRRRNGDWRSVAGFCGDIASVSASGCKLVQKGWSEGKQGKAAAKALGEGFFELVNGEMAEVLRAWREHRYPAVMRFLQRAAEEFTRERLATGRLGFEDLLLGAAALLREHPGARRELGLRYRHLLVDEFQDTDPIQAEVCFLLASDPREGKEWRRVTPRPGGLFVVGDPKQSIYRFRRADILVYEIVRDRLAACGDVLRLSRNFRSGKRIQTVVNRYFGEVFPAVAAQGQAAFTPMEVKADALIGAVLRYGVHPLKKNKADIVGEDAQLVASWIAERVLSGEYAPSDFLLLTAGKYGLDVYARALAERNLPVSTAGAKLPQELELRELILVLQLLSDPANPVLVAAALEGLFFGCSPADLFDARQAGLDFSVAHRPASTECHAGRGLAKLYEWWIVAQRQPADLLLDRILDDTGLLPYAASLALGENRAGTLLHLVAAVRAAAASGASDLAAAIELIERTLADENTDAALRPGRTDAVRLMNLHKAKGLEARVVCLLAPIDRSEHEPTACVDRQESGHAVGGLLIGMAKGNTMELIAQPPGWAELAARESGFQAAERERLLYVATTRAKETLLVAQLDRMNAKGEAVPDRSFWAPLGAVLAAEATVFDLQPAAAPGRNQLGETSATLAARVIDADARRNAAASPTFTTRTVTESAKAARTEERSYDLASGSGSGAGKGNGTRWGSAVHRMVEAMGRGRSGESLQSFIRAVVRDEALGETTDERRLLSERLWQLAESLSKRAEWALLRAGDARFELRVVRVEQDGDMQAVTEGVIDAVASGPDGWRVFDWKTESVGAAVWSDRLVGYQAQVDAYARMLHQSSGQLAIGEVISLATAMGSDSLPVSEHLAEQIVERNG